MKKPQKTLHISVPQEDDDMYFDLMRTSSRNMVPIASLVRYYMREGMKVAKRPVLV